MVIKGEGILYHHFWGSYYASLGIQFGSQDEAMAAIRSGKLPKEFKIYDKHPDSVSCFVDGDVLNSSIVPGLVSLGADQSAIASIKYSVDCGEPWTICFDAVDPNQIPLFDEL